jgi:chorismate dehydratase
MDQKQRLRIGAVSYLNTKPLVYRLAEFAPNAEVVYDVPSRLADQLAAGTLDVALIPSIEYLQHADYRVVSNACIACRGPVLSVKLFSRIPMERIRSLALDEGSRTSVALARILLRQRFGLTPDLLPLPLDTDARLTDADAVLLIGDRAIRPAPDAYALEWDLGQQWWDWSGLPFVFAMWTARSGTDADQLAVALQQARDAGLQELPAIAEREASAVGLTADECLVYLRDYLYFFLGTHELRGLREFSRLAAEIGMVPPTAAAMPRELILHDCRDS